MGLFIVLWCQACDNVNNELLEIVGVEEMQKFSLYTDIYGVFGFSIAETDRLCMIYLKSKERIVNWFG